MTSSNRLGRRSYQDRARLDVGGQGQNVYDVYTKSTARRSTTRIQGLVNVTSSTYSFGVQQCVGRCDAAHGRTPARLSRGQGLHPDRAADRDLDDSDPGGDGRHAIPQLVAAHRRKRCSRRILFEIRDVIDQVPRRQRQAPVDWLDTARGATATCARFPSIRSPIRPTPGGTVPAESDPSNPSAEPESTTSRAARGNITRRHGLRGFLEFAGWRRCNSTVIQRRRQPSGFSPKGRLRLAHGQETDAAAAASVVGRLSGRLTRPADSHTYAALPFSATRLPNRDRYEPLSGREEGNLLAIARERRRSAGAIGPRTEGPLVADDGRRVTRHTGGESHVVTAVRSSCAGGDRY